MSTIQQNILEKIEQSHTILIVSSRPADPDCIGSNLALRWFIEEKYNKYCDSVIFGGLTERVEWIPEVEKVEHRFIGEFDFNKYDLIISVDGSHWDRVFQDNFKKRVLPTISEFNFVGIDHHEKGDISTELPETFLQKTEVSCSKVIYDYFIKNSGLEITPLVATWLYAGLVDDTGRFTYDITPQTFNFAAELLKLGADHKLCVNEAYQLEQIEFTAWAIYHTEFNEEIKTSILVITNELSEELNGKFGNNWERKIIGLHYNETVMRRAKNFDYGIFFQLDFRNGGVRTGWRTRNYGNQISVREVLEKMGFEAGGHFGAGGGYSKTADISKVRDEFVELMKNRVY
ncbi:MAG: hypothetical protein Kow0081_5030 [Candidatus Dojkabacteria bacterium]